MEPFSINGRTYRFRKLGSADTVSVIEIIADIMAWGSQDGATYLSHLDGLVNDLSSRQRKVPNAAGEVREEAFSTPMMSGYVQPIFMMLTPLFGVPLAKEKIYNWVESTLQVPDPEEDDLWVMCPPGIFRDPEIIGMGDDLELFEQLANHPQIGKTAQAVARLLRVNPLKKIFAPPVEDAPVNKVTEQPVPG